MDPRIARLKTSRDARQVAEHAGAKGLLELQAEAQARAKTLQASEDGYTTPAQIAIGIALYTYEEEQRRLKKRPNYRANRLRKMLKEHGALLTAERMALDPQRSTGFDVLEKADKQELTFEAIIARFSEEFSVEALAAAQARLRGEPLPRRPRSQVFPVPTPSTANGAAPRPAKLDGEAKVFWAGLKEPTNKFMADWLPKYKTAVEKIEQILSAGHAGELFHTIWTARDNDIANAGYGALNYDIDDAMREDLIQVIRDINADDSANNYEHIVARFESWRDEKRIPWVPRLLVARAFAAIHPNDYHTTVDIDSQDDAIQWFVAHTGFVEPRSKIWAERARALTNHMSRIEELAGDIFIRNMFPWFIAEQVNVQKPFKRFHPGYKPRAPVATSDISEHQRKIDLRHNRVQKVLYKELADQHGKEKVATEHATGTGGYADAVVELSENEFYLYEIKIAATATEVVRQAMGQLLEYGFRKGGLNPVKLFAVGEPLLDDVTKEYIARLQREFNLDLTYLRIKLEE